jgi:glycosyltransferase involved in cell wall biosynthesis
LKVSHFNTYNHGGAFKAVERLYRNQINLNDASLSIKLVNKIQNKTNIPTFYKRLKKRFFEKISIQYDWEIEIYKNEVKKVRSEILEMANLPVSNVDITSLAEYKKCDIVHFHWVADFLDWPTFFKKNKKPVVWTLHDRNPFLGVEHVKDDVLGIDSKGKPIRRIRSIEELTVEEKWMKLKKQSISQCKNIHIVSPSRWIYQEAIDSDMFNQFSHYYIPNSVPSEIYKLKSKIESRNTFSIPPDKIVLLFVADVMNKLHKGYIFLEKAIENLKNTDIILCSVGKSNKVIQSENVIHIDYVKDEIVMAELYSAADAFIIPSIEDNLPNTMLESLMCGTPVIGFPIGGIAETIEDGVNGYLCDEISVNALEKTIRKYIENKNLFNREQISLDARKKFSGDIQARAYLDLYKKILNNKMA